MPGGQYAERVVMSTWPAPGGRQRTGQGLGISDIVEQQQPPVAARGESRVHPVGGISGITRVPHAEDRRQLGVGGREHRLVLGRKLPDKAVTSRVPVRELESDTRLADTAKPVQYQQLRRRTASCQPFAHFREQIIAASQLHRAWRQPEWPLRHLWPARYRVPAWMYCVVRASTVTSRPALTAVSVTNGPSGSACGLPFRPAAGPGLTAAAEGDLAQRAHRGCRHHP